MKPKKQIPKFSSEDEEREFWDTHDFTDYIDWNSGRPSFLTHLRPPSLGGNPFADLVLVITEARPGWVLLDLKPVQLDLRAWRLLRALALKPGLAVKMRELRESGESGAAPIEDSVSHIRERFAEAAPGREALVHIGGEYVALELRDRNVIVAREAVGAHSKKD